MNMNDVYREKSGGVTSFFHKINERTLAALFVGTLFGIWCSFAAAAIDTSVPERMVRETIERVLTILKEETLDDAQDSRLGHKLVTDQILPLLDFPAFAKLTLGTHWRTATPEQRIRFTRESQSMLIRTYSKYLVTYADTRVSFLPTRLSDKYVFVNTELVTATGKAPMRVSYRFKQSGGAWKAIDVAVNGLSMAKIFRTSFTDEINTTSLEALIRRLSVTNDPSIALSPNSLRDQ
jgi:phospholipid transport system substrate-binding protein